jgi:hypothetical protein
LGGFGFEVLLFDNQLSLLQQLIRASLTDSTSTWAEPLLLPGQAQTKNSPNAKTSNSPRLATTSSLLITGSRLLGSDALHDSRRRRRPFDSDLRNWPPPPRRRGILLSPKVRETRLRELGRLERRRSDAGDALIPPNCQTASLAGPCHWRHDPHQRLRQGIRRLRCCSRVPRPSSPVVSCHARFSGSGVPVLPNLNPHRGRVVVDLPPAHHRHGLAGAPIFTLSTCPSMYHSHL